MFMFMLIISSIKKNNLRVLLKVLFCKFSNVISNSNNSQKPNLKDEVKLLCALCYYIVAILWMIVKVLLSLASLNSKRQSQSDE